MGHTSNGETFRRKTLGLMDIKRSPLPGHREQGKALPANTLDRTTKPLAELASEINREHELAEQAAQTAVGHALRCGELLLECKAQIPHGGWLPWIETHFGGSERTARRYLKIARNRELLEAKSDTVADLSLRGALELIAKDDAPAESAEFDVLAHINHWFAELEKVQALDRAYKRQMVEDLPILDSLSFAERLTICGHADSLVIEYFAVESAIEHQVRYLTFKLFEPFKLCSDAELGKGLRWDADVIAGLRAFGSLETGPEEIPPIDVFLKRVLASAGGVDPYALKMAEQRGQL